jgi:nicotinate phosphoribosyltransferase
LPAVGSGINYQTGELKVTTTGDWPVVSFWETVAMSEVNELYFENYLLINDIDPLEAYEEGDRRLSEKIETLKQHPEIKFADFGTRRRFSYRWQKYVLERLVRECPGNIVGTSNLALAKRLGIKPIGTFAHEMPMVYAALADQRGQDIRSSFGDFLDDWRNLYGPDYGIALSDTFGSDSFFEDFKRQPMEDWKGLRQDSGDPFAFGEKAIDFYRQQGINPATKTIVFSDGLDLRKIIRLQRYFEGRVNVLFGWGTSLTNDLGIPALNIVMKATSVNGVETVKLSDDRGKNMGPLGKVAMYKRVFKPVSEAASEGEETSRPDGDAEINRIAVL